MKVKLNRSMQVVYDEESRVLKLGKTFLDYFEIDHPPKFLIDMLMDLNISTSIDKIKLKYSILASEESYDIDSMLNQLIEEKIIVEDWIEDRYDRHKLFLELSGLNSKDSMNTISESTIGIIGAGGIGSNVATLLAAAGVGRIKVSDGDKIESSNLTRSIMYNESQISKLKVESLKENILKLNSNCIVETLPLLLSSSKNRSSEFVDFFSGCQLIILAADPENAFELISHIQDYSKIPVLNAGYIGRLGVIGPMLTHDSSPSFKDLYHLSEQNNKAIVINNSYQAPSYGPLNFIVSGICANEVIKYIITQNIELKNKRLVINPDNYETLLLNIEEQVNEVQRECTEKPFDVLADYYESQRETTSLNKEILDNEFIKLTNGRRFSRVLDVGCGIGTYSRLLSNENYVVGLDSNAKMINIARKFGGNISYIKGSLENYHDNDKYDLLVMSLILNHIENLDSYIKKAKSLLKKGGHLICIIPNPVKDSCNVTSDDTLILTSFFEEGLINKARYDAQRNEVCRLDSQKRTLQTYIESFLNKDFKLTHFSEPRNKDENHLSHTVPYFTIMEFQNEC